MMGVLPSILLVVSVALWVMSSRKASTQMIGLALSVGVLSRTQWLRILRGFGIQVTLSVLALALWVVLLRFAFATGNVALGLLLELLLNL